ncbi:hypothetical protein [Tardiphaga sp. 42S5]|uniref:hypothetical protein n=1 Tax=Tardiphaga sp. 42S5 TaxID=1404799 RepID=UPI002A5999E3|nr:hypothetical protein [Tardiphaga sp. 42S5]WPO40109.1 hypothetical protein SFY93_21565 [Tardiphaga sp. 42S5]
MTPPTPDDQARGDGGPEEAALYIKSDIKSAVRDLSRMARRHRHDMLAYLLDMAHLETEEILRLCDLRKPSGR